VVYAVNLTSLPVGWGVGVGTGEGVGVGVVPAAHVITALSPAFKLNVLLVANTTAAFNADAARMLPQINNIFFVIVHNVSCNAGSPHLVINMIEV